MLIRIPSLVTSAALAVIMPAVANAQAATGGRPMTGSTPMHPWFDWIFFAILIPWLVVAALDLVRTR